MGLQFLKIPLRITKDSEFTLKDRIASGDTGSAGNVGKKALHVSFHASGRWMGNNQNIFDTYEIVSHHTDFNKTATINAVNYLAGQWNVPLKDLRQYK